MSYKKGLSKQHKTSHEVIPFFPVFILLVISHFVTHFLFPIMCCYTVFILSLISRFVTHLLMTYNNVIVS